MQEQMALYIDHIEWARRTQRSQGSYRTSKSIGTLSARSGTYDSQFKTTVKKGGTFSMVTTTTSGGL
jgi:hypothetical protein